jgi:hypothetical protein
MADLLDMRKAPCPAYNRGPDIGTASTLDINLLINAHDLVFPNQDLNPLPLWSHQQRPR